MNDESIMQFGKHKGERLEDIPDSYLLWLYDTHSESLEQRHPKLFEYLQSNLDAIKANCKKR